MLQGKRSKTVKNPARVPGYISPNQLTICGFETPFEQALTSENRWVKLNKLLPWDKMVAQYDKGFKSTEGRLEATYTTGTYNTFYLLDVT